MLPLERHRQLLNLLNEQNGARTAVLARRLGVTQETVRRDFEKLEKDGVLIRTHGGAVKVESSRREYPVMERAKSQAKQKRMIAEAALSLISDGQTIFFDSSTTVQALAALLPDQPLTVLTNSLQIPAILSSKPEIRVIVLGGNFRASSLSCTGMVANLSADIFRIDAVFMSCRGLSEQGLSEAAEEQASLKRHLLSKAGAFYLLADSTKSGVVSSYFYADNSEVDQWITDLEPAADFRAQLEAKNVRIRVARN